MKDRVVSLVKGAVKHGFLKRDDILEVNPWYVICHRDSCYFNGKFANRKFEQYLDWCDKRRLECRTDFKLLGKRHEHILRTIKLIAEQYSIEFANVCMSAPGLSFEEYSFSDCEQLHGTRFYDIDIPFYMRCAFVRISESWMFEPLSKMIEQLGHELQNIRTSETAYKLSRSKDNASKAVCQLRALGFVA